MPGQPDPGRILVADVGGTHLNLGLLEADGHGFRLLRKARSLTQEEGSLLAPIRRFLDADPGRRPSRACLAGAGPVAKGRLRLTHAPWDIDGPALERALGLPVKVVNDFVALAAGTLQLDRQDPAQVIHLVREDGTAPPVDPEGVVLVVGAGTGLGAGFLVPGSTGPHARASEGGHLGLPVFDEASLALWQYLHRSLGVPPEAESAVSGPGLVRLLSFLLETGRAPRSPACEALFRRPEAERPAALSALAGQDPACGRAVALFVDLYAQVCADLCAAFLPAGGLFLAGGLVTRHPGWFSEGGRFRARFEHNGRPHVESLARATPVGMVRDYDLSLYGAGWAWDVA